jgi:hypothetical protein
MKQQMITAALAVAFGATIALAGGDPANLVGTKMCGICHKKEDTGNQLGNWEKSPHAKAFATLGTPEAKEAAKKLGIDDPQKSGKCLKCHSTAYWFSEKIATEKIKPEEGVTCESCHGAGKDYKSKSVMENREKSIAAGMVYPATKSCTQCHNAESPTFKGFDEAKYAEKVAHPNPKAKK